MQELEPKDFKIPSTPFKKEEIKKIDLFKKPELDTSLNIFEWIQAKIFTTKYDMEVKMWSTVKNFLAGKLVRMVMTAAGGVLSYAGISEQSVTEIVGGVITLSISLIWSILTHKKVALMNPEEFFPK